MSYHNGIEWLYTGQDIAEAAGVSKIALYQWMRDNGYIAKPHDDSGHVITPKGRQIDLRLKSEPNTHKKSAVYNTVQFTQTARDWILGEILAEAA